MKDIMHDKRIVMTLDAGGTNFVFNALQGGKPILEPIRLEANGNNLKQCLNNLLTGFALVKSKLKGHPVAISFAFPGPADYVNGIIGDLGNLPAFRGGIALGPMLEDKFGVPVFINNDGDLFAYGEAIGGLLPKINKKLRDAGSAKQFQNLLGVTLGTGFGGGIVSKGRLFLGDNGAAGEIWLLRNKLFPACFAEEGASIRAVVNAYKKVSKSPVKGELTPKDIYEIASGTKEGDINAAKMAFIELGQVVGDALANAITLVDGLIVIGGGLSAASKYFMPAITDELNGSIERMNGELVNRLEMKAFSLEDPLQLKKFIQSKQIEIAVPFSDRKVMYDPVKRIGVGIATLDTSHAISLGAYAFALAEIDLKSK